MASRYKQNINSAQRATDTETDMTSAEIKALRIALNAQLEIAERQAAEREAFEADMIALSDQLAFEADMISLRNELLAELN